MPAATHDEPAPLAGADVAAEQLPLARKTRSPQRMRWQPTPANFLGGKDGAAADHFRSLKGKDGAAADAFRR